MSTLLETIQLDSAPNPTVSIIWMHGLGADGNDFVPLVKELDLRGCPAITESHRLHHLDARPGRRRQRLRAPGERT